MANKNAVQAVSCPLGMPNEVQHSELGYIIFFPSFTPMPWKLSSWVEIYYEYFGCQLSYIGNVAIWKPMFRENYQQMQYSFSFKNFAVN